MNNKSFTKDFIVGNVKVSEWTNFLKEQYMPKDKYINEDTYQTLQDIKIEPQSDFENAIKPLWKKNKDQVKLQLEQSPHQIFLASPVHSDVSIHYTQALLEFQQACFKEKLKYHFI